MQTSHQKPAVEQNSQTELQHKALHYLKEFGPLRWAALYVRFDSDRSGAIGQALQDLQERRCIEVGPDNTAKITAWGMAQLQHGV